MAPREVRQGSAQPSGTRRPEEFHLRLGYQHLGYHLRAEPARDLHPIVAIEIEGQFHFVQQELAFALADLGGRRYGSAEAPVLDQPTVWVATTDQAAEKTTISWRTTDGKPLNEPPPVPVRTPRFPGLLELSAPSRDHGRSYQSGRGGTHPIKDPVAQAQDCKHVLHRLLVQYGSEASAARFAHLVAFPFTGISPGWSYAGCPRDMILASSDLPAAAERIRTAIDRHGGGYAPLTGAGLESLLEVLEGQLPGQISLLSWAEENEAYVDQLTRDQAKVMRILRMQRRLKVIGSAGTGKTWLALEHARLLAAAAGERAALVCYSRGLARFLQRMTAQWPPA